MEVQDAWTSLTVAWQDGDLEEAAIQAERLLFWVSQGGTPPETSVETPSGMGDPWDKAVTEAVCKLVLSTKADGDPPGS